MAVGRGVMKVVACAAAVLAVALGVAQVASAGGGSASNGPRTLTVSNVTDLNPSGDTVTVTGSGYDETKGIYVAFCVIPAAGQRPTPCGGGVDMSGSGGGSKWISSNPPAYAVGLTTPYGPGGTFSVELSFNSLIGTTNPTDCAVTACAVVTFADHTIIDDRSQDVIVPVSFGTGQPVPTNTAAAAGPTNTPAAGASATSVPATATPAPANTAAAATATTTGQGTVAAGGTAPTAQATSQVAPTSVAGVPPTGTGTQDDGGGNNALLFAILSVVAVGVISAGGYGLYRYQRARS